MDRDFRNFDQIYRAYAVQIYRYLLSIGCPAQDAEDIMQETFVKALLRIDSYRGDAQISVWLCQIAKNTWPDHLRKYKRTLPLDQAQFSVTNDPLCEWLDLVERLEEPYRSVFYKVTFAGATYEELAKAHGKSASWARVTYYRARMKLQEMLKDGRN